MKRFFLFCLIIILLTAGNALAQPGSLFLDVLIDMPTAKILNSGQIQTQLRMYNNGGLLSSMSVGITDRFFMGISYGGEKIIGTGNINLNPLPCVRAGYLIFKELNLFPAILIGFNSQGYGAYNKNLNRYLIKCKGLYAVFSKNTSYLGGLGIHAGVNKSISNDDKDKSINFFAGCHKWINSELLILAEYDAGMNDNNSKALGEGKGFLNFGLRWNFSKYIFFEFAWKNLLENIDNVNGSTRIVKIYYLTHF